MAIPVPKAHGAARTWSVHSLLEWGSASLAGRGFEESYLHAELLLAHALRMSRSQLTIQRDRALDAGDVDTYGRLLARRLTHEPLQYIVGETEFMGIPVTVDPRVLIPRPETEVLVERVLDWIRTRGEERLRILDIGTGSGCIAIALARFAPLCDIIGLDVSPAALEVAALNVARHGVPMVSLEPGDIFLDPLPGRTFDGVVANPPYVPAEEFQRLQPEVRDFEPPVATSDGGDGLRFIRRIAQFAAERLEPDGRVFVEIGFGMSRQSRGILGAAGLSDINLYNDLAGIERVISAVRPPAGQSR